MTFKDEPKIDLNSLLSRANYDESVYFCHELRTHRIHPFLKPMPLVLYVFQALN
jgi:hypothetical protein